RPQTDSTPEPADEPTTPTPGEETTPQEPAPDEPAPEEPPAGTANPEEGARLDAQAFRLIQQGQYEEAVPIARQAVASFPDTSTEMNYAFALYNLGTALNRSGNPDEAIQYLEKRLEISTFKTDVVQAELDKARAAAG
ncbi:MAG: tetratricopeptide repeat protein, partial [Thermoleophilaceae bacterium]|nr:tetratricopeptide repeat protein [Thermoleophilaceae bacterium]